MNIIIVPRQDEVTVFADGDGIVLTQDNPALAVYGSAEAVQTVRIPLHCIDALVAALVAAKSGGTA